jgi:hypothetical protein
MITGPVILVLIMIILITIEGVSYSVYGPILNSKDVNDALDYHTPKGIRINSLDSNILTLGDNSDYGKHEMPFISCGSLSIFSKYYINDVGRVSRFSKEHKRIKQIFKQAHHELKKTPTLTIKQKLKIK